MDAKLRVVHRLLKFLNEDEAAEFKKWCANCSRKEKEKLARHIERAGITIVQPPVGSANILDYAAAYEEFPPKYQRIVYADGGKSLRKVLCAKMFFIRLKQDPYEKFSARSRGPVNPLTMLPNKSNARKRFLAPYSDVAVRFEELQLEVMLTMVPHPACIADYMMENSSSFEAKLAQDEQGYLGDPEEDFASGEEIVMSRKNIEHIGALINVLGTRIVQEIRTAPEGQWFNDD